MLTSAEQPRIYHTSPGVHRALSESRGLDCNHLFAQEPCALGWITHARATAGHDFTRLWRKDRCRIIPREYHDHSFSILKGYVQSLMWMQQLYDRSRWTLVRQQFRETFLSLYALPSQSLLSLSTHAGLSALRLPCCRAPDEVATPTPTTLPSSNRQSINEILNDELAEDNDSVKSQRSDVVERAAGNVDCPTCHKHLGLLAEQVAMSHHVNSTIVCRISGEVMDSQNEPMAFPNGYVYSSKVSLPSSSLVLNRWRSELTSVGIARDGKG